MISADQLSTSAGASVAGFDTRGLQGSPPTGNGARDIGALFDSEEVLNDSKTGKHRGSCGVGRMGEHSAGFGVGDDVVGRSVKTAVTPATMRSTCYKYVLVVWRGLEGA